MLFQMSLTGALMIVLIVLIRALLLNHLPKRVFLLLWLLVLVRLLVPFPILIGPMVNAPKAIQVEPIREALLRVNLPLMASSLPIVNDVVAARGVDWVSLIYWQGALLVGVYLLCAYIMLRRVLSRSKVMVKGFAVDFVKQQNLKRKVLVCVVNEIKSPLTFGLFRPRILLPEAIAEDEEQLRCVLTHELTHIRQFDAPLKLLIGVALCAHWFNPLVWLMYILFNRDLEIACDERVVQRMGVNIKADYAALLLSMKRPNTPMSALSNGFSQQVLSERVVAIMEYRKAGIESAAIAISLLLIIGATLGVGLRLRPIPVSQDILTPLSAESCVPIEHSVPRELVFNYHGEYWQIAGNSIQPVLDLMEPGYELLRVAEFDARVVAALGDNPPLYIDWEYEGDMSDEGYERARRFLNTDYRFAVEDILSKKTNQPYNRQSYETPCLDRTLCYDLSYTTIDPNNITVSQRSQRIYEFEQRVNEFAHSINFNVERVYAFGDEISLMLSTPAFEIRLTDIGRLEAED